MPASAARCRESGLRHQAFLFRLVDIANELFAMAASISRAEALRATNAPQAAEARDLALQFSRTARRRIKQLFGDLWSNDDTLKYRSAPDVLKGRHAWMEAGIMATQAAPAVAGAPAQAHEPASEPAGVA